MQVETLGLKHIASRSPHDMYWSLTICFGPEWRDNVRINRFLIYASFGSFRKMGKFINVIYKCNLEFLSRVSTLTSDIDIAFCLYVRPSVRPSICLSVRNTLVLYENGLTYRLVFFTIQ